MPTKTPEEMLQNLGVGSKDDYAQLSTCDQIEIYSIVGAEFLDLEYATTWVPTWLDEELSKNPELEISNCIVC